MVDLSFCLSFYFIMVLSDTTAINKINLNFPKLHLKYLAKTLNIMKEIWCICSTAKLNGQFVSSTLLSRIRTQVSCASELKEISHCMFLMSTFLETLILYLCNLANIPLSTIWRLSLVMSCWLKEIFICVTKQTTQTSYLTSKQDTTPKMNIYLKTKTCSLYLMTRLN